MLDARFRESEGWAYDEESPGNVIVFFVEVVDEEDEDDGDDEGGDPFADSDKVEG